MRTINPYLSFNGNCLEAFEFYKSVFGGEFCSINRYKDAPEDPGNPLPEEVKEKIMHMSLPISAETVLNGSDACEAFGQHAVMGGNIELMIEASTKEEVDSLWEKLSIGATVTMPLEVAFWGDYFGSLTDKFGIRWMLICSMENKES